MSFLTRVFGLDPEKAARRLAIREFKKEMPARGKFDEVKRSALASYYDRRFGAFDPGLDKWEDGEADVLKANPLLRRIDVIADSLFRSGSFMLRGVGDVRSMDGQDEGAIAVIGMMDGPGILSGSLMLDIGGEIRFSKLTLFTDSIDGITVRVSALDRGMVIQPSFMEKRALPESIHERAADGSEIFQTLSDTLAGIERILGRGMQR